MSKDFKDIIASRGITVNVFKDDSEVDIAIRLVRATIDEMNDRLTEVSDLVIADSEDDDGSSNPPEVRLTERLK